MLRDLLDLACSLQIGASEPLESVLPSHPLLGQTHSSAHILRQQHDSEGQTIRATLQRRRRRSIDNTHARVAARARRNDSAPPIDDAEANAVPVQETFRKQIQALERTIQEADASDVDDETALREWEEAVGVAVRPLSSPAEAATTLTALSP